MCSILQLPSIKPDVRFSEYELFQSSSSRGFRFHLAFQYSFHRSYRNNSELIALPAISFSSLLQKHGWRYWPPFPLPRLCCPWDTSGNMGKSDSLIDPVKTSFPLYPPVALLSGIDKGLPCSLSHGCPCPCHPCVPPEAHLSVLVVIVRINAIRSSPL